MATVTTLPSLSSIQQPELQKPKTPKYVRPDIRKAEEHFQKSKADLGTKKEDRLGATSKLFINQVEDMIKIFVATLKYQDPTDPVDVTKLTEQTFQLSQTVATMENSRAIQNMSQIQQLQLLKPEPGKIAEIRGNTFFYSPGEESELYYELPFKAAALTVQVFDTRGQQIYTQNIVPENGQKEISPGKFKLVWDGETNTRLGQAIAKDGKMPEGRYHFTLVAFDVNGTPLKQQDGQLLKMPTSVRSRISGVSLAKDKPMLNFPGGVTAPLDINTLLSLHEAPSSEKATLEDLFSELKSKIDPKIKLLEKGIKKNIHKVRQDGPNFVKKPEVKKIIDQLKK